MNRQLHDSLFELYMQGGLELYLASTRGIRKEFVVDLETSALTPDKGEIIHFFAVNRWDEDDVFDEFAKPSRPLTADAERLLGFTNEKLAHCRSTDVVLDEFLTFLDR